ncbi:MAG: B12-binding domain-containing radical SAM protein [Treponema sp. GWB1_62_6]|nr:MAG: B12-binding domain-containing radical SAM protein [Treponema sp. GWA1_62_8]OHE68100.1 MAG: B12-binding domain-containing radical SAM protein [Treponema sp. GWB1_62_6]OHE68653.1 MAG: B12-binding domain-containing radical SAM protein [Treponema sp. GWC1_61_84]OHE70369.1 MAG: B12-binding domain-containing radical SAM protein [Treponema sp. RIFOXYC1_FULL_61_9]HCM26604.1 B12-binding domain-containing radical SAM protein [Treponema sp.]
MPDILLTTINAKWIHPSLALRLLKANLRELEVRTEIIEFALRQPLREKMDAILAARHRILGISVSIWNHSQTLELLHALEEPWAAAGVRPLIVLGGPEAANLPSDAPLLAECDWLVRGEAEHSFRELCAALLSGCEPEAGGAIARVFRVATSRPSSLPDGATYGVVESAAVDPSSVDPGYRLYTDGDLERRLTYVEASRGCPFGCEFCLSSLDRIVRDFPLDAFLHEMEALIARGARQFKFLDRTFNLDKGRAGRIMEFFLERVKPGFYVHFEIVPSRFPSELGAIAARFPAGSLRLEAGIQTMDPRVAATIGRKSDPDAELATLRFLREKTRAIVHADLIAGLPGETLEAFGRGFDMLLSARPEEVQVGILKRLPGAPLARHDGPFKMRYSAEPPYEVLSTSAMSPTDLDRLKNFSRFWELIVNRGNFPEFTAAFLASDSGIFSRFIVLSDTLLLLFGRNWGIDRHELRSALNQSFPFL